MKKLPLVLLLLALLLTFVAGGLTQRSALAAQEEKEPGPKVAIVWTSGDRDVALKMVFMYGLNAKRRNWADEVELIVWGPSAKLLSEDSELQKEVAAMMEVGVVFKACKACSDSYGVSDELAALGVEVKYMGVELTELIDSDDWEMVTF